MSQSSTFGNATCEEEQMKYLFVVTGTKNPTGWSIIAQPKDGEKVKIEFDQYRDGLEEKLSNILKEWFPGAHIVRVK